MRLYTRCIILKMARSDDWTMLGAQILAIVAGTSTMLGNETLIFPLTKMVPEAEFLSQKHTTALVVMSKRCRRANFAKT